MSKATDMQGHFQSFNSALKNEVERIEAMRKDVETKEKALNNEKDRMMTIKVEDDDVVSLNIGGKIMAASRSTLCQVEGSLLASMFSGRWEDRLKKDKHDNVFLDFNPECFKLILNYLRAKKIETPRSKAKTPNPPEGETSNYWNLVDYLGLREELGGDEERRDCKKTMPKTSHERSRKAPAEEVVSDYKLCSSEETSSCDIEKIVGKTVEPNDYNKKRGKKNSLW